MTSVAGLRRGSDPSLIAGASPHDTATSSKSSQLSQLSDSECSPSTKTLEKLRSFKFVKTFNLKSRSVHTKRPSTSDDQSELTPPPNKRRSISDDNSPPSDSVARCADISKINSGSTFKQPSFNPRTSFNSLTCTPSSQSERQSALHVGSKVTPIAHRSRTPDFVASHSQSIENSPMVVTGLPSTPTLSQCRASSMHGGMLSTPQSTPNSSQSNARLTTPQRRAVADPTMQTPTRARQTTPLVSTPTGSGVTTPIARASVPLRRKFPGPAGLLPSLVSNVTALLELVLLTTISFQAFGLIPASHQKCRPLASIFDSRLTWSGLTATNGIIVFIWLHCDAALPLINFSSFRLLVRVWTTFTSPHPPPQPQHPLQGKRSAIHDVPYSRKYLQELNLAVEPKIAIARIWWFGMGLPYIVCILP